MLLLLLGVTGWSPAHAGVDTCNLRVTRERSFEITSQPASYRFTNDGPDACANTTIALGVHTDSIGFFLDGWASEPGTGGVSVQVVTPSGMPPGLADQCSSTATYHNLQAFGGGWGWTCQQTLGSGQSIIVGAYVPEDEFPDNCVSAAIGTHRGSQTWRPQDRIWWDYPSNGFVDPDHANNHTWYSCQESGGGGQYQIRLRWTKTASAPAVNLNDLVTYTLTAQNQGTADPWQTASTVRTIDPLPPGLEYVSSTAPAGSSCTYAPSTRLFQCFSSTIPATQSRVYTLVARAIAGGEVVNACTGTARNAGGGAQGVTIDDSACVAPVQVLDSNVVATKTGAAASVPTSSPISWTIAVTNTGTTAASNVVVTDTLPAGVTAISASGAGWTCNVAGLAVTCSRASLAGGASAPITVAGTSPATPGNITNTCVVNASNGTADSSQCNETTTITPRSSVTFTKSASPNPVLAGAPITWTVTATNAGPNAASSVVMTDTLPAGVTNIAASGSGWTCGIAGLTVTCNRASLPVGSSSIAITGNAPTVAGNIVNTCVATAAPGATLDLTNCRTTTTVNPRSEIVLSKVVSAATIPAGQPLTWTITAQNQGPTAATNVVVTDAVPAGVTAIAASGSGWSCGVAGQSVTCSRASMAVGSNTIMINGNAPTTTGTITNTCTGTATTDPSVDSTLCRAVTTITPRSVINVSKTASPAVVPAQGPITWTVSVQNQGPSVATNLVVTDTLPTGVTSIAASGAGWSCSIAGQVATCSRPSLAVGTSTITITGNAPAQPGTIQNVCVASAGTGGVVNAAACRVNTTVTPVSAITVTKTASPNPVVAGEEIRWDILVNNAGPSTATNVVVTDTLPAGVTYIGSTGFGWFCDAAGQVITCQRASMPVGNALIRIRGTAPLVPGTITNTCVATAGTGSTVDDDGCEVDTDVTPNVHVIATKTASASVVGAGEAISWTIEVHNAGPGDAHDVTVTDTVPAGVTAINVVAADWSCSSIGQVVTCDRPTLPPGTSAITIDGIAPLDPGTIENTCVVETPDDAAADSAGCRAVTVVGANSQVVVTKSATPNPVTAGAPITWTLSVTNQGPGNAFNVIVDDTLPPGVTNIVAAGPGWTCTVVGQAASCSIPVLNVGESLVTITGNAPAQPGPITNVCVASADGGQPVDTTACDVTTIVTENAPVIVRKVAVENLVDAGAPVEWVIEVENLGPSMAREVVVTDTVPDGVTNIAATSTDGFTCSVTGNTVDCSIANLPVGVAEIHITGNAPLVAGNVLNVCAAVAASTPAPDDSACEAGIDVLSNYELQVIKTGATPTVPANGPITWTIAVTNGGPGTATDVVVTDTVPAGVTNVSAAGDGWSCSGDDSEWICTRAVLAAGTSEIVVTGTAPAETGPIENTCVVSTAQGKGALPYECDETTEIVEDAQIVTFKTATPEPVGTGEPITWTITVQNLGPSVATSVVVSDDMPAGVTNIVADGGATWSCSVASQHVECSAASLAIGESTIEIVGNAPLVAGDITNTCVTSAPDSATPPDDSACTVTSTVVPSAEISVVKTASAPTVIAGGPISWTLTVTNAGPGNATNLLVTDTVPTGVTNVSADGGADWTCGVAGQVVNCTRATMGVGSSSIAIAGTAPAQPGPITNVCVIESDADPAPDATQCVVTTIVDGSSNVSAVKTAGAPVVEAGAPISWTITVTNTGPSDAEGVVVTDAVPAGVTGVAASGAGWTCSVSGNAVSCTRAVLPVGSSAIAVTGTAPLVAGPITNACVVETSDGAADSSLCSVSTDITPSSQVSAVKLADAATAEPGGVLGWTIRVTNAGPGHAADVVVRDEVPVGVTGVSASGPAGWTCGVAGQVVTCTAAELAVATVDLRVTGTAPTEPGPIRNTCVIEADGEVQDGARCDVTTEVEGSYDVTVRKTAAAPIVPVGGSLAWTIEVANAGPSEAPDVVVVDTMPAGVTSIAASGDGWTCAVADLVVTCSRPTLAVGTSTIQLSGTAPTEPGAIRNTCVVTIEGTSLSTPECDAGTDIEPNGGTDLAVSKVGRVMPREDGDAYTMIEWEITVTNVGEQPAENAVLVDAWPAGLAMYTAGRDPWPEGWACSPQQGSGFRCEHAAAIAPGESHQFLAYGRVDGAPTEDLRFVNVATVSTSSDDVDPTNDRAQASVTVPAGDGGGDPGGVHPVPALDWRGLAVLAALMAAVAGVMRRRFG